MRKTFHYLGKIFFKISLSMLDKDGDGKIEVEEILSSALEITKLTR
jgi:Ca2+-binding EF-hand superfamily protein